MNQVAIWSAEDRAALFQQSASQRGFLPLIVEKDFWVCWTLNQVFELPHLREHIIFKGGTSLSKVFGLIKRFSEDIDLSIDRAFLGFTGERDIASPDMSGNQRKALLKQLPKECEAKIANDLLPALKQSFSDVLSASNSQAGEWKLYLDPQDPQNLLFTYPSGVSQARGVPAYNAPIVKMEFGARADHWPAGKHTVVPYAAEDFGKAFQMPSCSVRALEAERTFWEKATILHAEYYRPEKTVLNAPPTRRNELSRHYYDLVQIADSAIGQQALSNFGLLEQVAEHKRLFFPSAWANYKEAGPGSLRLVPPEWKQEFFRHDYDAMQNMFFPDHQPPSFDEILERLHALEEQINA